jgi:hypothetical protein
MKLLKTLATGSLVLGFAGSMWATTYTDVYVSGSTAFRTATVNTEISLLGGSGAVATAESDTNSVASTTISVVAGSDGTNFIAFHNHWTGSLAGVVDMTNANALSQIDDSVLGAPGSNVSSAATPDTGVPQVAMSDNVYTDAKIMLSNANTKGKNFAKNIANITDGGTSAGANGGPVAIVTFEWVLGAISTGAPTPTNWTSLNITQDQASYLLSNGSIPLSIVDGNSADAGNFLAFIGRNEDSGTRINYDGLNWAVGLAPTSLAGSTVQWMAEQSTTPGGTAIASGYPTSSNGAGYPSISAKGGITALQQWTAGWTLNTETGVTWTTGGHSGYNGGGDVAAILKSPNPVVGLTYTNGSTDTASFGSTFNSATSQVYIVTCIGTHDGFGAGTILTYNGQTINEANIQNGLYPLWNYEHLYYQTTLTGTPKTAADELADAIFNASESVLGGGAATLAAGSAGMPIAGMNVIRGSSVDSQIK